MPVTKTETRNSGHVGASATAVTPTAATAVATVTGRRAGARPSAHIPPNTPTRDPANETLIGVPATGTLRANLWLSTSTSGP